MASVKVILKRNKLVNGQAPLYLRIIKHRKTKFVSLQLKVMPSDWNEETSKVKKSHPNSARMNHLISTKIVEAESIAIELESKSNSVNSNTIKERLMGKASPNFFNYTTICLKRLKEAGNEGTYRRAKSVLAKLEAYNKSILFEDLNVTFLKAYEHHLKTKYNNSVNTIHANLRIIRKVLNDAVNEDLLPRDKNPFYKFKLKLEKTQRAYLTEEELLKVEKLKLIPGSRIFNHRNMYVFAAYAGGLRISDILQLKWKNFDGLKINLQIQKTNTPLSIKLPEKALKIIKYYQKINNIANSKLCHDDYIFPVLRTNQTSDRITMHNSISSASAYINRDLKALALKAKINKSISFHTSRHTWATLALKKGMRMEYVSKLMGHAAIKETQVYAKIVNEELDKAMDIFN